MHPAGLVDFKQHCNNNVVPVCYQLAGDLFCWGIDSDSTAIKGMKRANLEQILHKTEKKNNHCACPEGRSGVH